MSRRNSMISDLWQRIGRTTSAGPKNYPANFTCRRSFWLNLVLTAMVAFTITACGPSGGGGSSGGGGGGSSPGNLSAPADLIVSGVVSAPGGGVVAFLPNKNLFEKFADILFTPVYAAITGLVSVPDDTQVDLVRINIDGTVNSRLATTKTVGGKYSFNFTRLGLTTSSDLVVQVLDSSNAVKMRAFVTTDTVNIDPISETAVRLVLEKAAASSLSNFTTRELVDIGAAVNLLVMTKPLAVEQDIEATVTAFKRAVAVDANITSFIVGASAAGQTLQGPGDIGNYFPFDQGNTWVYQVTTKENDGSTTPYVNTLQIVGTKLVDGVMTSVLRETNPLNSGIASEEYLAKNNQAITYHGSNDATDFLSAQIGTYREYIFPIGLNSSFVAINKSGLTWPDSEGDGDGIPETVSINATVTVAGFETVAVAAGTYTNAAKIVTNATLLIALSANGAIDTETITLTEWYAPSVGLVKSVSVSQSSVYDFIYTRTTTEELKKFVPDFSLASLTVGLRHSCALTSKGVAYCWGDNTYGQLGVGTTANIATPAVVLGGIKFISLEAGSNHTCGLTEGGEAYCWGDNSSGQLGNTTTVTNLTPVTVSGRLHFTSISSGGSHTCGLTAGGIAYCWGDNGVGQLGNGTTAASATPVKVSGADVFAAISAGGQHTCSIKANGAAFCWGINFSLGNDAKTNSTTPTAVLGNLALVKIHTSGYHTCGLTAQGTAYCWGSNSFGEIGNGVLGFNAPTPVAVSGSHAFTGVNAGSSHTCGVTSSGEAYCWGLGLSSNFGNDFIDISSVPVPVLGGLTFIAVDAAGSHSCGIIAGGVMYCWGWNTSGELGNGTNLSSPFPVAVSPPS